MESVTFTVNKANVYTEVAKTTSFLGIKKSSDGTLYEQIFTTDEDRLMLERFWNEAGNSMTELFKNFISSAPDTTQAHGIDLATNYSLTAQLPSNYDTNLNNSISSSMFSYFVNYIVSKWMKFLDKSEADSYGLEAVALMEDIKSKLFYRKRPTRTKPAEDANTNTGSTSSSQ